MLARLPCVGALALLSGCAWFGDGAKDDCAGASCSDAAGAGTGAAGSASGAAGAGSGTGSGAAGGLGGAGGAAGPCAGVTCFPSAPCHLGGTCDPATGVCSADTLAPDGTPCSDGLACTSGDACQAGQCATEAAACDDGRACSLDRCDEVAGGCSSDTSPCPCTTAADCDDGNACNGAETCAAAGICTPGDPVTCPASTSACTTNVCNGSTGLCEASPGAPDGTACDDGDACTEGDTCLAGACSGGSALTCTALSPCRLPGTCDPLSGACSEPFAPDGVGCDDGNACTEGDTCASGACRPGPEKACPDDACHDGGDCDPTSGVCDRPEKLDGTACDDGLFCTTEDACESGACVGASVACDDGVDCTTDACSEALGGCAADRSACACSDDGDCDDDNPCNGVETCGAALTCVAGSAVDCSASGDACHTGSCDPTSGACVALPKPNGTTCNDGDACTRSDACQAGACTGSNPVTCTAQDQCHTQGACNPQTGLCTSPAKANGTNCNDGNACTQADSCQGGTCTGGGAVTCTASDQCHLAGTCSTSTGLCSNPAKTNGTGCDDGSTCTATDSCQAGVCTGGTNTCTSCGTNPTYDGHITYYTLTSTVACHYPTSTLPQYYGAMNEFDYATAAACGACVEITNQQNNAKLTVAIVDECPYAGNEQWCYSGSHHIDLNPAAYQALGADNNPAISWRYVACPVMGNVRYYVDAGSNQYYLAVTPMNHRYRLEKVEVWKNNAYVALARADYNVWILSSGAGPGPFRFRVTDIYGHAVEDTNVPLSLGQIIDGAAQLPPCN